MPGSFLGMIHPFLDFRDTGFAAGHILLFVRVYTILPISERSIPAMPQQRP
jgi:hypothetical protein